MQNGSPFPNGKVCYAVSGTVDGNMSYLWGNADEVTENRKRFLAKYSMRPEDCVVMKLEHKDRVEVVHPFDRSANDADAVVAEALITNHSGVALFLLTADCLPISLYDPCHGVIALAHLGWRPTDKLLIKKVIRVMFEKFGSEPQDIVAHIGPGIHKESYVFKDPEQKKLSGWAPYCHDLPNGETAIDIIGYNIAQLLEVGVIAEHISADPSDTAAAPEYFSHYRAVRNNEKEGRFATILTLRT